MKKMEKQSKRLFKAIIFALALSLLSSCGYEPVFYGIMHDVLPEDATVNGNITSIARASTNPSDPAAEYIFLSGGGALKYKTLASSQHGDWKVVQNLPFALHYYNYFPSSTTPEGHIGQQILRVLADRDYLYLLSASYTTDTEYGIVLPEKFYLWSCPLSKILNTKSDDWVDLTKDKQALFITQYKSSEGSFQTYFNFFMTNSPNPAHRKAYFVQTPADQDAKYYALEGTSLREISSIASEGTFIAVNKDNTRANSAFYLGDTLYFSDSLVVTTNASSSSPANLACLAGISTSYYSTRELFTFDGSQTQSLLETDTPIASLMMTADSILIGKGSYTSSYTSNGGIDRVLLQADGKPENTISDFTNNAKYQFTSAYIMMAMLCADPSKSEAEADLYAAVTFRGTSGSSSASFDNIGLWSYYPGRGNWNRE